MAAQKSPNPVRLVTTMTGPPAAVAASIALAVMSAAKARTWSQTQPLPGHIRLSPDQADALDRSANMLTYLRGRTSEGPAVTVAVCPECRRWLLVAGSGSPGKKCGLALRCPGVPVKVVAAKMVPFEPEPGPESGTDWSMG